MAAPDSGALSLFTGLEGKSMKELVLNISGMSCGHCLNTVNKTLTGMPGVEARSVKLGQADVSFDESRTTVDAICQALNEAGYPALPAGQS